MNQYQFTICTRLAATPGERYNTSSSPVAYYATNATTRAGAERQLCNKLYALRVKGIIGFGEVICNGIRTLNPHLPLEEGEVYHA